MAVEAEETNMKENGKLNISGNTRTVLERRYLRKALDGTLQETPEGLFRRVATHIAEAEGFYEDGLDPSAVADAFYGVMTDFRFLPNSPTLMNAGNELGQLAACFVLPVDDSLDGIFDAVKNAALIHKSGGGTGFSFSRLRAKDCRVGSTGGVASGPVSFMKIFNTATEQVKQGGTRRGANMAILRVDHPDVLEFIQCKSDNEALNNFNISVGVTDAFMQAVREGGDYDLIDPRNGETRGSLNAREVYETLIHQAWFNGDPGIIFLDRINRDNPTPALGEIESTNPCGEQPLLPMEACNLGSINLSKCVVTDGGKARIDFDSLKEIVWLAVRFLDDTIEMSRYPLDEIDQMVKGNRKIGLGVMGFADLLYMMGVPYNSDEAVGLAEKVMGFVQTEAHEASRHLAVSRGPFPNIGKSVFKGDENRAYRNATCTTIAPTGTLSILAGCSSGIEPVFALSYVRRVMDGDELLEVNPLFETMAKERGFYSKALMARIAETGTIAHMEEIPEDVRRVFVTAHDVSPEWHVRMQAAFQNHTDNAVSKTVNLPREATADDVQSIYDMAFDLCCKGVTIYRDGSKQNQVLSVAEKKTEEAPEAPLHQVRERPEILEGFTSKITTGMGQLYITVTEMDGRPFEVFATIGKSGKSTTAKTEAIGRLISLALRAGVDVSEIINQVKGIGGEHAVFQKGGRVLSIPDAIGRVLEKRYGNGTATPNGKKNAASLKGDACPECGGTVAHEEGCMKCHLCGYTKCG
ncbi:ribonucleotide-diphosphate reductase subunit alpha [Desulfoluna limicola]|uniref:Vitamin B12-dependent ribonucleotide reductase n=1 Tax=Desulfoluna limicola TaxID=2810562 RepID=A0ABM7PKJ7_9BACT|nr:vitamin B12-dependent ribonucleotide reductase [Desulfoluna limicola]BCS97686.1 ribonucleotide-diphosphate reductase subunit alpha [Desulfoluna limicola]